MQPPKLRFTIAFDEADQEGVVFFGNYFRLAHRALEQWLPAVGVPWAAWFDAKDFGVPLRHVAADYLGPMRPGQEFEATLQVSELGTSSVTFAYEFSINARVVARLTTVHVFVSRAPGWKKIPVPEEIRARLSALK